MLIRIKRCAMGWEASKVGDAKGVKRSPHAPTALARLLLELVDELTARLDRGDAHAATMVISTLFKPCDPEGVYVQAETDMTEGIRHHLDSHGR